MRFQVGEPWWWVTADGRICLYDAAAVAAFAPVADRRRARRRSTQAQKATLDAAGAVLAASTAALGRGGARPRAGRGAAAARLSADRARSAPEAKRANVPLGWAAPAFDVLQLEDYDWVTERARRGVRARGRRGRSPARLSGRQRSIISPASCSTAERAGAMARRSPRRRRRRGARGSGGGVRLGAAAGAPRRLHHFRRGSCRWTRSRTCAFRSRSGARRRSSRPSRPRSSRPQPGPSSATATGPMRG